jgi:hypothetical protein
VPTAVIALRLHFEAIPRTAGLRSVAMPTTVGPQLLALESCAEIRRHRREPARRGIATRIIDRAVGRSPQSRALVVHARTLEITDLAGVSEAFVESG